MYRSFLQDLPGSMTLPAGYFTTSCLASKCFSVKWKPQSASTRPILWVMYKSLPSLLNVCWERFRFSFLDKNSCDLSCHLSYHLSCDVCWYDFSFTIPVGSKHTLRHAREGKETVELRTCKTACSWHTVNAICFIFLQQLLSQEGHNTESRSFVWLTHSTAGVLCDPLCSMNMMYLLLINLLVCFRLKTTSPLSHLGGEHSLHLFWIHFSAAIHQERLCTWHNSYNRAHAV